MASPPVRTEESIPDLLRQLVEDGNHLVRTEIRLAKAEVRDNIAAAVRGGVSIGIGVVLALGAIFTLLGAAVGFLTPLLGAGWAALLVGLVALAVGGLLVVTGAKKLSPASLVPDRAIGSIKADAATIAKEVS